MRNLRMAVAALPVTCLLLTGCSAVAHGPAAPTTTPPSPSTVKERATAGQLSSVTPPVAVAVCQPETMKAAPATRGNSQHPDSYMVTTAVTNKSTKPCVIKGFPQVAITGLPPATGPWPHKDLKVTPEGTAYPVTLVPGDGAVVTLTFRQATGGKCASGATPNQPPVVLLGVPDVGIELTMADGSDFIECGDTVIASPFEAHLP